MKFTNLKMQKMFGMMSQIYGLIELDRGDLIYILIFSKITIYKRRKDLI